MNYMDIINDNCVNHSSIKWWPKFAYHYTDVSNAVNILGTGYLYSRLDATELGVMKNDNASKKVIDMTNSNVKSMVRFYFRPLTPTQYYNEGYKHPNLRFHQDINANVPVPVFFLFNLAKLLEMPGVEFSEKSQAGNGSILHSGVEEFSKLNFDNIYDNSYANLNLTKNYRHAEIIHPNKLNIDTCLERVLCRNELEKLTLLNLLQDKNPAAYNKYKNKIGVLQTNLFENNGLYITDCSYHENIINLSFTDNYNYNKFIDKIMKQNEIKTLTPIRVNVLISWKNKKSIIHEEYAIFTIDMLHLTPVNIKVSSIPSANSINIKVCFENSLMCYFVQSLEFSEVIK